MEDCVFCKIVKGEIPTKVVKKTANLIVFEDTKPKAPLHYIICAKKHVADIREDNGVIWSSMGKLATKLTRESAFKGYRITHNMGEAALVKHMHVHFLGGVIQSREV